MSSSRPVEALIKQLAGPTDWRTLRDDEAEQAWESLREWVEWLVHRFALDYRVVPPCWYLHPPLVELLSALHDHHRFAFDPLQTPSSASEWHRVFQDLEHRLRDWASRTGCTRDQHRAAVMIAWPDDEERWRDHVTSDLGARIAGDH